MKQRGQFYLVINARLKQTNGKKILQLGTCCWHLLARTWQKETSLTWNLASKTAYPTLEPPG
jgi:hypothetical protein